MMPVGWDVDLDVVRAHVAEEYDGIFDAAMVESFIDEYVGADLAEDHVRRVTELVRDLPNPVDVLDVGAGYGSFVLAAREQGMHAIGLEPQSFELAYARKRLATVRPGDDPTFVYVSGDGRALLFDDASFDVVTLWNVAEHVADFDRLATEVARVLRPGGTLLLLCPNYASFRHEAHYQVPWLPLLPRGIAARYLRALGRRPDFFVHHIHYRTPAQVTRDLRRVGLEPRSAAPRALEKLEQPDNIQRPLVRRAVRLAVRLGAATAVRRLLELNQRNPLRRTIDLVAVRR